MLRTLWKWLAATFSVIVILLAIGIGLFRLILPLVPRYHERIEAFASEAAGTPVRIERIDARWSLRGPELRFHNAQLLTTDGSEALLSAETGSVVINLGTLLRHRQFSAGRVVLDGLRLEVLRDAAGQWQIGGTTRQPGSGSLPRRLAVGLRKAQVVFRDETAQVGPWVFDDVDLNVKLEDQHLDVDGKLKLPAELGGTIDASLQADGDFSSLDTVTWQAYLNGASLAFSGWTGLLPNDKTIPIAGDGDVVVWLAMQGDRLQQASAQVDLRDVVLAREGETIKLLDIVKGRVEFDQTDIGWKSAGRDISLTSGGFSWPTTTFEIEQVGGDNEDGLLYADIDFIRLQDVGPMAGWLPDENVQSWLERLQPRGDVENFSFRLTREQGRVDSYTLRTRFSSLGMNPAARIPGFDSLRGDLRMDAYGGRLQLDPDSVIVNLPDIIDKPVNTRRMNGVIVWRHNADGWRIVSDNIDLDHAAFRSSANFELMIPADNASPTLDLRVNLSDVEVAGLRSLIPNPILQPDLRSWVDSALVGGQVPEAKIAWSGALKNFPFDDGDGDFRVDAELKNVEIAYARNWPVALGLNGTLSFHNASFMAGLNAADLSGNRVSSGSISMEDLRQPVLKIQASADGMLDKLHGFLKATPVVKSDDDPLARVEFSGVGTTDVDLTLPLKHMRDRDVSVMVSTESGEVALRGLKHRLEQVEGALRYRNGEFSGTGITALVLGAPVVIDVAPSTLQTDQGRTATTVATARGAVTDLELSRLHPSLDSMLHGGTVYTATVTFPQKSAAMPVTVEIVSRLEGMAVTLPEPVTKAAAIPQDFLLTVALPPGGVQTDVVYGDVANARINWLRDAGEPWVLDRGGIHFGLEPARLPDSAGLVINGVARRLDVSGWLGLGESGKSSQTAPITLARLEVERLDAYGQQLDDAVLSIDRSEREWLVQVDSAAVSGALFVPFALRQHPIIANLERLYINTEPDKDAGGIAGSAVGEAAQMDPRKVPQMDIQADDFKLGDMKLGQLRARLRSTADGIDLEEFSTAAAAFTVAGSGAWSIAGQAQRCSLELQLRSTDVKPTLVDLGFDSSIDSREAEIDMSLNWPGPPGPSFKQHLNGAVKVHVGAGQLQTVEPGAGRVFGLFSFAALPRRLSLDFRDVFDTGFGFDYIDGDFTLDNGDAYTSNLILEGPAAHVGIAGRAGLVARDYDQTAIVYGNFGSALPMAGVLAGGPVGGAAMLIFSELFKKPLQDMARVSYRISGSWDKPAIERVLASAVAEGES